LFELNTLDERIKNAHHLYLEEFHNTIASKLDALRERVFKDVMTDMNLYECTGCLEMYPAGFSYFHCYCVYPEKLEEHWQDKLQTLNIFIEKAEKILLKYE
jgi:hypothetical protein